MSENITVSIWGDDRPATADLVYALRKISNKSVEVHEMNWKAICATTGWAANELERMQRINSHLLDVINGISRQTAEIVKAHREESP